MKLKRLLGWDSLVLLFIVGMLIGPSVVPGWDLDTIRRVGGGRVRGKRRDRLDRAPDRPARVQDVRRLT